jgi:divalent metal cation (Fe/Co/Zn/Cd) transporter
LAIKALYLNLNMLQTLNFTNPYRLAKFLAWFTIAYNLAEGIISTYFGFEEETLALFGFGLDSFIEMISSIGILVMINRITLNPQTSASTFEKKALTLTGYCLYALAVLLLITAGLSVYQRHIPENTFSGVIIAMISIGIMYWLIIEKVKVGKKLDSKAIIADANCAKVCMYMSVVLLVSSLINYLVEIPFVDAAGALGIAYFSYSEGKESLEKAKGNHSCSCDACE